MSEEKSIVERIISLGEGRVETLLQDMMANPKVMEAFGKVVQRTQDAREALTKNLRQMYSWANLPSQDDLQKFSRTLDNLDARLDDIERRIEDIGKKTSAKKAAAPKKKAAPKKAGK